MIDRDGLASAYWSGDRWSDPDPPVEGLDRTPWDVIFELVDVGEPSVVELLVALTETAPNDFEVGMVGAGFLEQLFSVHARRLGRADGADLLGALETAARRHERFRRALRSVFFGEEVPASVRDRLQKYLG